MARCGNGEHVDADSDADMNEKDADDDGMTVVDAVVDEAKSDTLQSAATMAGIVCLALISDRESCHLHAPHQKAPLGNVDE